jgi:hypothetical protein
LLDVRLFARRSFGSAAAINLTLGVALFGVALLLPLYFQIIGNRSPLETGLLLIPQGLGAAVAISIAGALTDKLGARRVVPVGILLALAGTLAYTQIGVDSGYGYLAGALFLIGAGLGATITPSMAAAFQDLEHAEIPGATGAQRRPARRRLARHCAARGRPPANDRRKRQRLPRRHRAGDSAREARPAAHRPGDRGRIRNHLLARLCAHSCRARASSLAPTKTEGATMTTITLETDGHATAVERRAEIEPLGLDRLRSV